MYSNFFLWDSKFRKNLRLVLWQLSTYNPRLVGQVDWPTEPHGSGWQLVLVICLKCLNIAVLFYFVSFILILFLSEMYICMQTY